MEIKNITFDILKVNKIPELWDSYILTKLGTVENFDDLISGNVILSELALPAARKEVAKTIYSAGIEPNLLKQKFAVKEVMGSVGEALTELLLPGKDVSVNNPGYDVEYCGNYIEVKSTIKDKALMSNVQYNTADYLIVHKFDKSTGKYCSSLLAPLALVHWFKPERTKSVSVSTKTDIWSRGLRVTPVRILKYFERINCMPSVDAEVVCAECHSSILVDGEVKLGKLTVQCKGCSWDNWESRYSYYYYNYLTRRHLPKEPVSIAPINCKFLVVENKGKKEILNTPTIILNVEESEVSMHYCPSLYPKRKIKTENLNVIYDFSNLLQYMSEAIGDGKEVMEFYISKNDHEVECVVRSNLAPIRPGYYEEKFKLGSEPSFIRESLEIMDFLVEHLTDET